jgi:hypothetical protein
MTAAGVAIGYAIGIAVQPACAPLAPCRGQFYTVPQGPNFGAIVGSMSATVLDTVFFTYRQRLSWTAAAPAPTKRTWALAPYVEPHGAGVAAAGAL